jgi:hypothetical protein
MVCYSPNPTFSWCSASLRPCVLVPPQEKYEILDRIGEGTFGEVHKARCIHNGELVAVKRVRLRDIEAGGPCTLASPLVDADPSCVLFGGEVHMETWTAHVCALACVCA